MNTAKTDNPKPRLNGLTFFPIPKFTDAEVAFGARENAYFQRRNRPEVPKEYEDAAHSLFFKGGKPPEFKPVVDRNLAARATRAWLKSFDPSHQSKISTVAYAFWVWSTIEG